MNHGLGNRRVVEYRSDRQKQIVRNQKVLRSQARAMMLDGMSIRDVAGRLGLSMYLVEEIMRMDLINALTREKFLRNSLRLSRLMYRRLWAQTYDRFDGGAPRSQPHKTVR